MTQHTTENTDWFNSLSPGRIKWNFRGVIFKLTLVTVGWVISCEIPLSRMSMNLTDDRSTLVQVMACYRQACWPISMSPYGVARPQWVKSLAPERSYFTSIFSNPFYKLSGVWLTHCGLAVSYGDIDLDQHWLRSWCVAWKHQAITWINVDLSLKVFCGIHKKCSWAVPFFNVNP